MLLPIFATMLTKTAIRLLILIEMYEIELTAYELG